MSGVDVDPPTGAGGLLLLGDGSVISPRQPGSGERGAGARSLPEGDVTPPATPATTPQEIQALTDPGDV